MFFIHLMTCSKIETTLGAVFTSLFFAALFVVVLFIIPFLIHINYRYKLNASYNIAGMFLISSIIGSFLLLLISGLIGNITTAHKYQREHTVDYLEAHNIYVQIDDDTQAITVHNKINKTPVHLYLLNRFNCNRDGDCGVSSYYIDIPAGKTETSSNIDLERHDMKVQPSKVAVLPDENKTDLTLYRMKDERIDSDIISVRNHTNLPVYVQHIAYAGNIDDLNVVVPAHQQRDNLLVEFSPHH